MQRPLGPPVTPPIGWAPVRVALALILGLAFAAVVWWFYATRGGSAAGSAAVRLYLTSFILELALSVDNLVVFAAIFSFFRVEGHHQQRALFWGILGAVVLRGLFILAGTAAIHAWQPATYVLGALLIVTAISVGRTTGAPYDPTTSTIYRFFAGLLPLTSAPHRGFFFHHEGHRRKATSLFLCLLLIEAADLLFALDSVPAALGVTSDPFLVYTSNIFAVLGLRSYYFLVAAGLHSLRYLRPTLVFLLLCIAAKTFVTGPWWQPVQIGVTESLIAVMTILSVGVLASWFSRSRSDGRQAFVDPGDLRPPMLRSTADPKCVSNPRSGGSG